MLCNNCGSEVDPDEAFCWNCGAPLKIDTVKKKKHRFVLILVAALLVVAIIAVVCSVLLVRSSREKKVKEQLKLAERYLDELDYDKAILAYREVLDIDEMNVDAYLGMAEAYVAKGDYDKAIRILEKGYDLTEDESIKKMLKEVKEEKRKMEEAAAEEEEEVEEIKEEFIQYQGEEIGDILDGTYASWQEAYYSIIRQTDYSVLVQDDNRSLGGYYSYALIYLDSDDIPELFVMHDCEASGERVLSFYDGKVGSLQLGRIGTSYIENSGLLCSNNGHMDYYPCLISQLREGRFYRVASGVSGGLDWGTEMMLDEAGMPIYQYEWEGKRVSEETYEASIDQIFDRSKGDRPEVWFTFTEMSCYLKTGGCTSDGHSYDIVVNDVNWSEAQRICERKGGYLATLTSPLEMDRIKTLIIDQGLEGYYFYVGFRDCEWIGDTFYSYRWIGKDGEIIPAECMMPAGDLNVWDCGLVAVEDGEITLYHGAEDMILENPAYIGKIGYICEYE